MAAPPADGSSGGGRWTPETWRYAPPSSLAAAATPGARIHGARTARTFYKFFFFFLFDPRSLKVKQQNRIKTHRLSQRARVLHRKKKNNNKNRVISSELIGQWNDDKPGEGGTEVEVRRWGGGKRKTAVHAPRCLSVRPSVRGSGNAQCSAGWGSVSSVCLGLRPERPQFLLEAWNRGR
ncbi:hypothetical protein ANANG_G00075860, partial [Anguilla anguilla]